MESAPSKYPATEEKTTLTDNRIFVISVKFRMMDCGADCNSVTDKDISFFLGFG